MAQEAIIQKCKKKKNPKMFQALQYEALHGGEKDK